MSEVISKETWKETIRENQDILGRCIHNMDMATKVGPFWKSYAENLASAIGAMNNVLNSTMHYLYEEKELTPKELLDKFYESYCTPENCGKCYFADSQNCRLKKMQHKLEQTTEKEKPDELIEHVATFQTLHEACEFCVLLKENSIISFTACDGGRGGWRVVYHK